MCILSPFAEITIALYGILFLSIKEINLYCTIKVKVDKNVDESDIK